MARRLTSFLLGGCLVAGVLSAPVAATATVQFESVAQTPRAAVAGVAQEPTAKPKRKRVRRAYGKAPVRTVPGRSYAVVFKGRRGDLVRMAPMGAAGRHGWFGPRQVRLVGPGGKRIAPGKVGFHRLRARGTYRFRFTATTKRTHLVKVVAIQAAPDRRVTRRAKRGIQYALDVRVPETGARLVAAQAFDRAVLGGRLLEEPPELRSGDDVLLVPGGPVLLDHVEWSDGAARSGQRLRALRPVGARLRVRSDDLPVLTPEVDGAPVSLPRSAAGAVVTVTADRAADLAAGLLDVRLPVESGWSVLALAPQGQLDSGAGLVRTSPSETTTLVLLPGWTRNDDDQVSLGSLALHPERVERDGPSVTVPVAEDGRRVLVPVSPEEDEERSRAARLVVSGAPEGPWRAEAGVLVTPVYPRGCNGCGESDTVRLESLGTSEWAFISGGRDTWVLLTASGEERTGDFDVAVVRDPS